MQDGPFTSADGYDGGTRVGAHDFTGGSHALTAPAARAVARTRAWINTRGWCAHDSATSYRVVSAARDALPAAHVVLRATPPHGAPVTLFVDPVTNLVNRTVLQLDENREVASYSDWRTVDGAAMAFKRKSTILKTTRPIPARSERSADAPFPSATFAQPAVPNDSACRRTCGVFACRTRSTANARERDDRREGPFPFVVDTGGHSS